jgi:transcriptional regulator with XRE-family HTH domain
LSAPNKSPNAFSVRPLSLRYVVIGELMTGNVAYIATLVNGQVAYRLNDLSPRSWQKLQMAQVSKIHQDKTPPRIHYIAEWADKRGKKQVDFVGATGADKGTVSRWFAGRLPEQPYLLKIAAFLAVDEPADLFRHPDDNWFKRMFEGRSQKEIDDSKQLVEIHLGKTGTED